MLSYLGVGQFGHDVSDIVPWVSVQALLQTLLVQEVTNEAHAASQHEQSVQTSNVHVLSGFLNSEAATVSE